MQAASSRKYRRAQRARTILVSLAAAILLGCAAPSNPVLSGAGVAVASQGGTGGGGP